MPQNNLNKVFTDNYGRLVSYARKNLKNAEDAEDIVQDVFYQFSRMESMAKPIEQITAWLFRVAKNTLINWQKKKRDIPFSFLLTADEDGEDVSGFIDILSSNETTPEIETLRSIVWNEIETAIDELPPIQRDIFVQTEFLCFPVKEISEKTGVSVNTLLSRKHNAIKHLRKKLSKLYTEFMEI